VDAERCLKFMLGQIRTGQLSPSKRFGENSIARKLGLGRGPVRTAFQRLHAMGLLRSQPGSGTFVHTVSLKRFCEIMDVRAGIEGFAGRLACARATEAELDQLEKLADKMDPFHEKAMTDGPKALLKMLNYDNDFHSRIVRLSGNRELERLLSMHHILERSFVLAARLPSGFERLRQKPIWHRDIVSALRSRDPDLADRTIRQHILTTKEAQMEESLSTDTSFAEVAISMSTRTSSRQLRRGDRSRPHKRKVDLS
jgi:DNA-binding GntR family transcriptional regulator